MAFCMECGNELIVGAKFCSNCGTEIGKVEKEKTNRKEMYEGELHKCPSCGELLNSFVVNCPLCGYELRNVKANSSVNELVKKIEKALTLDEKIELITNFYVPNTKEDIFDLFILAVSNLEDTNYDTDDAWQAKLEQTYHKARIMMGNSKDFEYIEKLYTRTCSKISKRGFFNFIRKNKKEFRKVLMILTGMLMIIVGIVMYIVLKDDELIGLFGLFVLMLGVNFIIWSNGFEEDKKKPKK